MTRGSYFAPHIIHPDENDLKRMDVLMAKYSDRPMDFANASLVAGAEKVGVNRIFTLDRDDFATYRLWSR